MQVFLLLVSSAAAAACLLVFVLKGWRGRPFEYYFAMGIALQFLIALPVGAYQGLAVLKRVQPKPLPARLAMAGIGAPFNMGGYTVRRVFEAMTDPLPPDELGRPQPTAVIKYPLYLIPLLIQVLGVAAVFARRMRLRQSFSDPVIGALGLAVLVNSLANAHWAWWGW